MRFCSDRGQTLRQDPSPTPAFSHLSHSGRKLFIYAATISRLDCTHGHTEPENDTLISRRGKGAHGVPLSEKWGRKQRKDA